MKRQPRKDIMPLRIDTTKCKDSEPQFNRLVADVMYAVGVGQIRNEEEAMKVYRRYYMLLLARHAAEANILDYAVLERFIGCHTNVSDVSDFQFNKSLILELNRTANAKLNIQMGGENV